jgi:hypothetical protein
MTIPVVRVIVAFGGRQAKRRRGVREAQRFEFAGDDDARAPLGRTSLRGKRVHAVHRGGFDRFVRVLASSLVARVEGAGPGRGSGLAGAGHRVVHPLSGLDGLRPPRTAVRSAAFLASSRVPLPARVVPAGR